MSMFKRIMSVIIWPILAYLMFELLEFVTSVALDDDILQFARRDATEFIWIFFALFVFFIVISVFVLFLNHRWFALKGTYDGASASLNMVTTFTSVTALVVQFAGGEIPKGFLTFTLGTILISMSLSITSKVLKWRRAHNIKKSFK